MSIPGPVKNRRSCTCRFLSSFSRDPVEDRPLLPSFLYLPGPSELPAGSLKLPWAADRDYAVGEFARNHGSQVPTRLVSSAKSWLSYSGIDRRSAVLPWKAPEDSRRISPVEASTRYLKHLCEAWNFNDCQGWCRESSRATRRNSRRCPLRFDAVARELTMEAARSRRPGARDSARRAAGCLLRLDRDQP